MTREHIIRALAGTLVLSGLALGWFVSPYGFLLAAFVGLNLLQSSLTRWCLAESLLHRAGIGVRQ